MRRPADGAESGLHRQSVDRFRFRVPFSSDEHFDDLRVGEKLPKVAELRVHHQFVPVEHLLRAVREQPRRCLEPDRSVVRRKRRLQNLPVLQAVLADVELDRGHLHFARQMFDAPFSAFERLEKHETSGDYYYSVAHRQFCHLRSCFW